MPFLSVKAPFKENGINTGHFYGGGYVKTLSCTLHSVPVYPYCQVQEQRSSHPTSALPPLSPSFLCLLRGVYMLIIICLPVHCIAMKSEEFKTIKFAMIEENSHCNNREKIFKDPGTKSYTV